MARVSSRFRALGQCPTELPPALSCRHLAERKEAVENSPYSPSHHLLLPSPPYNPQHSSGVDASVGKGSSFCGGKPGNRLGQPSSVELPTGNSDRWPFSLRCCGRCHRPFLHLLQGTSQITVSSSSWMSSFADTCHGGQCPLLGETYSEINTLCRVWVFHSRGRSNRWISDRYHQKQQYLSANDLDRTTVVWVNYHSHKINISTKSPWFNHNLKLFLADLFPLGLL